ncbi:hypothetical protein D3C87_79270 [compost metagenome]
MRKVKDKTEEIRERFKKEAPIGYELLDITHERENEKALRWMIKFRCDKNHIIKKRAAHAFTCIHCNFKIRESNKRISDSEIQKYLDEHINGYILMKSWTNDKFLCLELKCNKNHVYETSFNAIKRDRKCPDCRYLYRNERLDEEIRKHFLENKEGYKLLKIKRNKEKISVLESIIVQCPNNHVYPTSWYHFKNKRRCPICVSSCGEKEITRVLSENSINYEPEYTFEDCKYIKSLRFDFAIFKSNGEIKVLIEFDGIQHFEPIKRKSNTTDEEAKKDFGIGQKKDAIKNDYCKKNSIKLIRIPYWDFDKIEEIILREVIQK